MIRTKSRPKSLIYSEMKRWNNNDTLHYEANCYGFALNLAPQTIRQQIPSSFRINTQPGCISGVLNKFLPANGDILEPAAHVPGMMPRLFKENLLLQVVADGLIPCEGQPVIAEGYELVALFMRQDQTDYHWLRHIDQGCWLHKMGGAPVTAEDEKGKPIHVLSGANLGSYTDFVGYFHVPQSYSKKDGVKIGPQQLTLSCQTWLAEQLHDLAAIARITDNKAALERIEGLTDYLSLPAHQPDPLAPQKDYTALAAARVKASRPAHLDMSYMGR